jgi:hypothetical protein
MLYQWQLVKSKVIQSNFPGSFHDKISLTGTGFKPTLFEISFIIQRESNNQIKI